MKKIELQSLLILILFFALFPATVRSQTDAPLVLVITLDGPLTPAMREHLARGIRMAEDRDAEAIIVRLDTPGGNVSLMTDMVQEIRASQTPVIVYVAPPGAIAGSAGLLITMAGHAAAMAPDTAIGASSPVGSSGEDLDETIAAKEKNILKAQARSLGSNRSEAAIHLAEEAIDEAKAASAQEALQAGLIDFIAPNVDGLLKTLDGFEVQMGGTVLILNTSGAQVEEIQSSLVESLLAILANPNFVFLLIQIGAIAILVEIASPGGWVAGFVGVVCLALATYGLGVLPVNWFGVLFLALAFILFVLDIKAPTHGALTAAGVGSLIVGALVLFNSRDVPNFQRVSVPLVVSTSLMTGAMFFYILIYALRSRNIPPHMGQESLAGRIGKVSSDLNPRGIVQLGGESWTGEILDPTDPLPRGTRVEVIGVRGLKLLVRRAEQDVE